MGSVGKKQRERVVTLLISRIVSAGPATPEMSCPSLRPNWRAKRATFKFQVVDGELIVLRCLLCA